jgi:hypothetical protein
MRTGAEQNFFRQAPDRLLAAAYAIPRLPGQPHIHTEPNGRGQSYSTLRYTEPSTGSLPSRGKCVYLGRLSEEQIQMLVARVELRTEQHNGRVWKLEHYAPDIRQLRVQRTTAFARAKKLAAGCGLYFSGYELRRQRYSANGVSFEWAKSSDLAALAEALEELQHYLAYLAYTYELSRTMQRLDQLYRTSRGLPPSRQRELSRALGAAAAAARADQKILTAHEWVCQAWRDARKKEEPL